MRSIYCAIYQKCINMYHMRIQLTTIDRLSQYHNDENLALHVLNLVLQTCEACLPRCVGFCTSTTQRLNASGFSVRPNAFKYIQSDGARVKLYIRALEDLRVGDKVSISYIPDARKGSRGGAFLCSENSIAIWIVFFGTLSLLLKDKILHLFFPWIV